jgi:hypothetical protein
MATWYRGAISYQKEDEAGRLKTINEEYLVDSVSFTEAEARLYKQIVTEASDFSVKTITRMRLADIFAYDDGEQFFKAKVIYFSVDEKSGNEKKIVNFMLVNAEGIQQAMDRVNESMRNFLIPYEITDINLTKILDVFPYTLDEDKEPEIPANMRPLSEVMAERQAAQFKEEEDGDSGD